MLDQVSSGFIKHETVDSNTVSYQSPGGRLARDARDPLISKIDVAFIEPILGQNFDSALIGIHNIDAVRTDTPAGRQKRVIGYDVNFWNT